MPSIREINLEYLAHIPEEIKVIVVDDSNGSISPNRKNMEVYRYDDYTRVLDGQADLIPRKTDTCRSFGFYMAWREGFKKIITLDDDCKTHENFLAQHSIVGTNATVKSIEQRPWYNTLDILEWKPNGQPEARHYARGVPYCYRVEPPVDPTYSTIKGRVVCNMGLWLKVPDINGLDKLDKEVPEGIAIKEDTLAIAKGTNFSLCIMNVAILTEAIPAFYQLPMNIRICNAQLDRFGDIWSGYILKRLADVRGDVLTIGNPCVTHTKAGNTIRETRVEHFGHLLEHFFYPLVDESADATKSSDYATMYAEFAQNFTRGAQRMKLAPEYENFFTTMGDKMYRWAHLFMK